MVGKNDSAAYVLGDTEREMARLEQQAAFFADTTREVLVRAGIAPGMRVLDVGCGVGDVTAIAADLVGSAGSVHGIDISEQALSIAAARMKATGRHNASFAATPIDTLGDLSGFDAVVGRFILVHMADPTATVRMLAQQTKPGTTIAFIEMDMSTAAAIPPSPLMTQNVGRIMDVYRRAQKEADMGTGLFPTFRRAGLSPKLAGFTRIGSGAELAGIGFLVESVRSLMPFMAMLGIAQADEIGIDTLGQRLAAELGPDNCIFYPRLVGAWAKTAG